MSGSQLMGARGQNGWVDVAAGAHAVMGNAVPPSVYETLRQLD